MEKLLDISGLSVSYDAMPTLLDVSLEVGKGEVVGIVGESGSGKTTLLKAVIGLLGNQGQVDGGSILFGGRDMLAADAETLRRIRGKHISYIYQNPEASFCPIEKVGRHFRKALTRQGMAGGKEAEERILALLSRLDLHNGEQILDSYPFELSGGMNQRVAIALALILEPQLILADEPTSALDVIVQAQVVREFSMLREMFGVSLVFVSHNIGLVGYISDRIGVLYSGELVEFGTARHVLGNPLHPYTESLLEAVPSFDARALSGLGGHPAPASRRLGGCAFAPRCNRAKNDCFEKHPGARRGTSDHWACCRYVGGNG